MSGGNSFRYPGRQASDPAKMFRTLAQPRLGFPVLSGCPPNYDAAGDVICDSYNSVTSASPKLLPIKTYRIFFEICSTVDIYLS
jgi:hypothetical protein